MQIPRTDTLIAAWSGNRFWFAAATMPRGRPIRNASVDASAPRTIDLRRPGHTMSLQLKSR